MAEKEWRNLGKVVGKSAYDIAVENGFRGSEQDWIRYVEANGHNATAEADRAKREADRAKSEADGVFGDVSNAIKDELSGFIVTTDKVSSLRHTVECKVESINLASTVWSEYKHGTYSVKNLNLSPGKWTVKAELVGTAVTDSIFAFKRDNNDYPFVGMANAINLDGSTKSYTFDLSSADIPNPGISFYGNEAKFNEVIANYHITVSKSTEYTPYIPDLTAVTVSRYGENLLDDKKTIAGKNFSKAGNDFTFTADASSGDIDFTCEALDKLAGQEVTISCDATAMPNRIYLIQREAGINTPYYNTDKITYTVPAKGGGTVGNPNTLRFEPAVTGNKISNIRINIGSLKKPFKPYITPADYIPTADGTVSGMTSLSPNMTILSDNPGVNIEATYNQDTMKVIQKLTDRIAALEGKTTNI